MSTVSLCLSRHLHYLVQCLPLVSEGIYTYMSMNTLNSVGTCTNVPTVIFQLAEPTHMPTDFGPCMNLHSHTCWPNLPSVRICTYIATAYTGLCRYLHSQSNFTSMTSGDTCTRGPMPPCVLFMHMYSHAHCQPVLWRSLHSHAQKHHLVSFGTCTHMPTATL